MPFFIFFLFLAFFSTSIKFAQEETNSEFRGNISLETRYFFEEPLYDNQKQGNGFSVSAEPQYRYFFENQTDELKLVPFYRYDQFDARRTKGDVRELYWLRFGDDYEVLAGINRVFWGKAESRHLVNIINQVDAVESPDEESFLGQPMVKYTQFKDWGTLSFFLLPYFRARTFPGQDGRIRFPFVVDTENPEYESDLEELHPDFAIRYTHVIDDYDIGISYFQGTSREPIFKSVIQSDFTIKVIPRYEQIKQLGFDAQATKGAWLLKYEGIYRQGHGRDFYAHVTGFEYSFYGVAETEYDLGLLVEHLNDQREFDDTFQTAEAPITLFQNDIFFGTRLALNDIDDTSILAGGYYDLDDGSNFYQIEGETRFGESLKVTLTARSYGNNDEESLVYAFRNEDHLVLTLANYF